MVGMTILNVVDCGYRPWWIVGTIPVKVKTKDFDIGICYFSALCVTLMSNSKEWLVQFGIMCLEWNNIK